MKNVTKFDRANLAELRTELNAVLAKFGSNIEFDIGNMKFSDSQVEMKLTAKVKGATTFANRELELMMKTLNLVTEKNGKRLVRYDRKKFKFPFIYEDVKTGKMFKTSEQMAKIQFAA